MRTLVVTLLAVVCLSVVAASANGRATYPELLTINAVGLHGKRIVLSRHNVYPVVYDLSPDHRRLAYVPYTCDGCNPSDRLWLADVRRSTDRQVVQAPSGITEIAWAPGGRSIAISGFATWLVEPDGTGLRRIGDAGHELAWSPDGSMLAMSRLVQSGQGSRVSVLSVNTGTTRDIAPGQRPQWSPDGRSLLYEFVTGRQEAPKIRVVRLAGGRPRTVARGQWPQWSPDGRRIAFLRWSSETYEQTLLVVPSKGGRPHIVASAGTGAVFSWSPGGRWLAFTRRDPDSRRCNPVACDRLYVAPTSSGGRARRLAVERRLITPLAWSHGGRRLVYLAAIVPDG